MWLAGTKSPKTVQRKFKTRYGEQPPDAKLIKSWMLKLLVTGTVERDVSAGRPSTSAKTVANILPCFNNEITTRSWTTAPGTKEHSQGLRKRLKLHGTIRRLFRNRHHRTTMHASSLLSVCLKARCQCWFPAEDSFFSDDEIFHISGYVNRHNTRI